MELTFFRAGRRSMLPKINAFKRYYVRTVTGTVFLAHDDVVYYGKGVRTQEMKIVPIYGGSIFSTKY